MKDAINLIKQFFDSNEWKYDFIEDKNAFTANINMNNIVGVLRIYIFVKDTEYRVYAVLNSIVEEKAYSKVAEYLHRANYGLFNGNFEFDYRDGEVRYKTYVNFEKTTLSASIIEDSIFMPIFMFEKYGENLFRAMLGDANPEQLINDIEKKDSHNS